MTCKTKWTAPTSPLTPLTLIGLLGLLGGCQSPTVSPAAPAPAHAASTPPKVDTGAALFAACRDQDGLDSWDMPAPPAKIHGSTYYVGTCGIAAILIDTADGLILIDAATQKGGPAVAASIRALGFDPAKIRLLLTTHEHMDHAGGLAYIQRLSGAKLRALPAAQTALSTGKPDQDDPQYGTLDDIESVQLGDDLHDGSMVNFGGINLTAFATPVHTRGSTSYRWQSCEGKGPNACVTIAFMDSLSTPARAAYQFRQHPAQYDRIQSGFAKAAQLSCNLLITPHPSASALMERMAGQNALVQEGACAHYVATAKVNFENRLAKETE